MDWQDNSDQYGKGTSTHEWWFMVLERLFTTELTPDRRPEALCEGSDESERMARCSLRESRQRSDEHHAYLFNKFERQPTLLVGLW
jgi:hypothetical protein